MDKGPKISIIIPCYNCEGTLQEAFGSAYKQEFAEDEFEVVMVDDASTDGTRALMKKLAREHANAKLSSNERNLGGGATRNRAVHLAKAPVIFCLDSDDLLPDNTLRGMYYLLREKDADGVGFNHSTKFSGDPGSISRVDTFAYAGQKIPFENIFQRDGLCALYSVFMFTRDAFDSIGGYPESHGFDTQGFAWRFLAHGKTAQVAPGTNYLHRIGSKASYYAREYDKGLSNFNMKSILLEHAYLFNDEAKSFIEHFDCADFTRSLYDEFLKLSNPLCEDYRHYIAHIPPHEHDIQLEMGAIQRHSFRGICLRITNRIKKLRSRANI